MIIFTKHKVCNTVTSTEFVVILHEALYLKYLKFKNCFWSDFHVIKFFYFNLNISHLYRQTNIYAQSEFEIIGLLKLCCISMPPFIVVRPNPEPKFNHFSSK